MPPSLASYQKAAASIYNPQQAAEGRSLTTQEQTTQNTLEGEKGQVQTDYQAAISNLNSTLNSNIAKINQLYTERLGGNFSGLQGNDIGGAVSGALKQQGVIESTRANKLSEIGTAETNAKLTYNTDIGNLGSKYSSLKSQYANSAYSSAVKDYQTNQYRQEELGLRQQALNISAARAANAGSGKQPSMAQIKQADASTIGNFLQSKVGKDGHVSQETWNAAMNKWVSAGYSAKDFANQYTQFINQRYGGYHGFD